MHKNKSTEMSFPEIFGRKFTKQEYFTRELSKSTGRDGSDRCAFIENQVLHFGKPDSILPEISKCYINVKTLCESIIKEENGTE